MTIKQKIGAFLLPRLPISRRAFDLLRFETNAMMTRCIARLSPIAIARRRRLRRMDGIKVNLGSGGEGLAGWVNVDVRRHHHDQSLAWDIRRGLPFRDGQVSVLMAEHVIEHLDDRHEVPGLLREIHRALAPGGVVRIVVPDGERWVRAYVSGDPGAWSDLGFAQLPIDMPTAMTMLNHVFHQGGEHQFAWDFETLALALRSAGFRKVVKSSFGVSSRAGLAIDLAHHAPYSLYVEAIKDD